MPFSPVLVPDASWVLFKVWLTQRNYTQEIATHLKKLRCITSGHFQEGWKIQIPLSDVFTGKLGPSSRLLNYLNQMFVLQILQVFDIPNNSPASSRRSTAKPTTISQVVEPSQIQVTVRGSQRNSPEASAPSIGGGKTASAQHFRENSGLMHHYYRYSYKTSLRSELTKVTGSPGNF